jgi:hypothetical protein
MKRKLVRLLIAGFVLAILGASSGWSADNSQQYLGSLSKDGGATKLFDGGEPEPICSPGDQLCRPKPPNRSVFPAIETAVR